MTYTILMKFKSIAVASFLACIPLAHASFEMMILAGASGLHRYDPQNNVTLGRFGQLGGYYYDVALDPTRQGEVVALNSQGGVDRYDYSTGEFRGGFNPGGFYSNVKPQISVLGNGNILLTTYPLTLTYGTTKLYSPTGTLLNTLQQFGSSYQTLDSIEAPDGSLHTLVRETSGGLHTFYLFNYNQSGTYTGYANLGNSTTNTEVYSNLGWVNNKLFASTGISGVAPSIQASSPPFNTTSFVSTNSYYPSGGFGNWVGGHNGIGYMVQSYLASSVRYNRLYYYSPTTNAAGLAPYSIPIDEQINGSAIVVAPEPGSMLVVGIGLACLARFRKQKSVAS